MFIPVMDYKLGPLYTILSSAPRWEQRAIRDCLLRNCEGAAEHVRVVHHVLFNHYRPNANGTELAVHYAGVMWGNEFPLKMDK